MTCDRDDTADELEFMRAIDAYKRRNGRMFPTWSEMLEVLRSLGDAKDEATLSGPAAGLGAIRARRGAKSTRRP